MGRFFFCMVFRLVVRLLRRIFPSSKKLTSVNFPSDFTMSLPPCQEFFSHILNFFRHPSAPLRPPFFRVCQVFFRISSSNFVFKIIQAPFSGFCQEIFSLKQQQKQQLCSKLFCPFFSFVKRFFHKSSSKIFLL